MAHTQSDNSSGVGGHLFSASLGEPKAPPYVCATCGHVERHPDPATQRKAARKHAETHVEVEAC